MSADIMMGIELAVLTANDKIRETSVSLGNKVSRRGEVTCVTSQDPDVGEDSTALQLKKVVITESHSWK